jgi:hypothetical protein
LILRRRLEASRDLQEGLLCRGDRDSGFARYLADAVSADGPSGHLLRLRESRRYWSYVDMTEIHEYACMDLQALMC